MRVIGDDMWAQLTLWAEARGEPYEGMVAVARVIRNRARQGWAHDYVGVVLQPYQFSCWNTQDPNRLSAARVDVADPNFVRCRQAWIESEAHDAGIGDAVMYYNPAGVSHTPAWATEDKYVTTVGHHAFYRG